MFCVRGSDDFGNNVKIVAYWATRALDMGVASFSHRDKEWAGSCVDNILHFVLAKKDCCCPYFRFAVAIIQQKHLSLSIDNSLAILWNCFNSLIARNYDPVVFSALLDPIRV